MVIIWYILAFAFILGMVFVWRKRYSNRDTKTDNLKAKKEDFNPEFNAKNDKREKDTNDPSN